MLRIGEFSILSKTTIKTIRYYEKMGLLQPSYIDKETKYRYYQYDKLKEISRIIALRDLGLPIKDIIEINKGKDIVEVLNKRKDQIKAEISKSNYQLTKINEFLEDKEMTYDVQIKTLPKCIVYYSEGVVKDYSKIVDFVFGAQKECTELNPNIKCTEPGYCFITYLDGKPNEENIRIRYSEAVTEKGLENKKIKFGILEPVKAVSIYHKGDYSKLSQTYAYILEYMQKNNLEMKELPRECYIDGCWNKENVDEYLTEIQIPIK